MENKNISFLDSKKVSLIDKYNFYEYLAVMLDSGVGLTSALESVTEKIKNPYFNLKIGELITFISSGDPFSKAMKKTPQIFPIGEISIIESAEQTGKLAEALEKLSEDLKQVHNLRNKIKGALTYPMIIFAFLFLAINIVLIYVIPKIRPLFEDADIELPFATKALLASSDFIIGNFLLLIFFFACVVVFFIGYKTTSSGKKHLDNLLLGVPLLGRVYRNYILSDIAGNLGSLIGSGVGVVKALSLVGKSTNNAIYEDLFEQIIKRVSAGEKIVESMESVDELHEYFPTDFLQMLSVGERSAQLEKVSGKIAKQYNRELDYSLSNLTKWIEPIAILIAGLFVTWFAFAIFGAILKVTTSIG